MVYAHLQLGAGRGGAAGHGDRGRADRPSTISPPPTPTPRCRRALRLERGDWSAAAAALPLDPAADAYPWKKYPQSEAVNAFARGIGAARSGDAAAAREEQHGSRPARRGAAAKLGYWAGQIDIQAAVVRALSRFARRARPRPARRSRRPPRAKTPPKSMSSRRAPWCRRASSLAEALLAAAKPAESLAEYDAVMKKEPNRYRAIAGAMAAARAAGDDKRARALAAELVKLGAELDTPRDGLRQAKEIAGG